MNRDLEKPGGQMKPRRYLVLLTLAVSALLVIAFCLPQLARAQDKPDDKSAPKKDLITVQPVATQPDSQSGKPGSPLVNQQPTAGQQPKVGNEVLITNTDLITFTVTVTDIYGRFVSGLGRSAFSVVDDKQPQDISYFSDDDAPVSVGVIFDVSGSMSGDKVRRARDALSHFIQTSHDSDEYFLIAFNSRVQLLLDRTRDGNAVLDKLTFIQTKNNTALYDACYLGVERVQRGTHPKRALLLISDGQDNNSRYTFNELRRVLKESDVVVYAIGILSGGDVGSSLGMEGQGILEELASVSGGKAFFPRTNAEMDDIFEQIALELRHQYSIGYRPPNFLSDGKWHRIKVKITPPRGLPRLFVRSKEGYFAIANPK